MKKPAVFLDRDGVLTREKSYVLRKEELEIFDFARECVEKIHKAGYFAIVITNQSAVGRGMLAEEELEKMNQLLQRKTGVDAVFYCPHWSPSGIVCNCRKPRTGMIEKAMDCFPIDLTNSYFVGERASDIETGRNVGIRTVLLESGYGTKRLEKEVAPDEVYKDLPAFVNARIIEIVPPKSKRMDCYTILNSWQKTPT